MGDDSFLMTELKETWESTYKAMIQSETTKIMVQASTLDGLPGFNDSVYKPYIGVCPIHSYKMNDSIIPNYSKDHKKKTVICSIGLYFRKTRKEDNKIIFEEWIKIWSWWPVESQCSTK